MSSDSGCDAANGPGGGYYYGGGYAEYSEGIHGYKLHDTIRHTSLHVNKLHCLEACRITAQLNVQLAVFLMCCNTH